MKSKKYLDRIKENRYLYTRGFGDGAKSAFKDILEHTRIVTTYGKIIEKQYIKAIAKDKYNIKI